MAATNDDGDDVAMPGTPVGGKKPSGAAGKAGSVNRAGAGGRVATGGASPIGGGGNICPGNQILVAGKCGCPPYAPTFCAADAKCVNSVKDPDHCGTCDTQCGATNACSAGVCSPDATTFAQVTACGTLALQVGAGQLYALASKAGKLVSITLPGGGAPVTVATDLGASTAFVLDDSNAYVAAGVTVTQVNLTTGTKTVLVSEAATVFDVAVSNGKIYYATGKDIKQADAATPSVGVVVASATDEGRPQGVTIASGMVLYVSGDAYNVEEDPIVGDAHVKLGASQAGLLFGHRSVQADATTVYWVNSAVQGAPVLGAEHLSSVVAQPIDGQPTVAFAVDSSARMAYLATSDGSFEKASFDQATQGEEATWVLRGLAQVTSIVLDETSAYIASGCNILQTSR